MKKNFQTEIIRSLNDINKNLKIINKSETFTKKSFSDGLLEWDHEENQIFKIKHRNRIYIKICGVHDRHT